MKRYSTYITCLWLTIGVLLLSACAHDQWESEGMPASGGSPVRTAQDSCYVNLHIVGNTQTATRATATEENAIYDGILCIFKGNSESTAQLKKAVVIDQLINNPGSASSIDVIQRLPIGTHPYPAIGDGKIYVMVLLNTTSTGFTVSNDMLYLNSTSLENKTRPQIQNMTVNSVGSPEKHVGLYMASKPKGTGSTPTQTAIQIYDPNSDNPSQYLYDRQTDITPSSSKLTLNVERAAAKVKVTNSIGTNLLTNINLDDNPSRHPKVHAMSWVINNYNTESYAISGGTGHTFTPVTFGASDFAVYKQRSHQSGEDVYIAENTSATETEVLVEVRLKDESNVLLDDCYKYELWGNVIFFTDASHVIEFFKQGWTDSFHNNFIHIGDKDAEEVFCQTKMVINPDASVTVTVSNPSFTGAGEQDDLASLSSTLSGTLTGYREGKMYYTYKVKTETSANVWENKVLHNNVYNLTLQASSITGLGRPTP